MNQYFHHGDNVFGPKICGNQNVTINYGCNAENEKREEEYCDFEEIKETPKPSLSKADKLRYCIEMLEREGVIGYKYDYAVIHKVIKDNDFDKLTTEEYCSLICSMDCVPDYHKPSVSSINAVSFRNMIYPSIEIADAKPEKNVHVKQVADKFYSTYKSL